jgi:hypothetical protein
MEELAGTWGWRVSSGAHEAGEAWGDAVHKATTPIKLGLTFLGGGAAHSRRQGENQQRAARRGRVSDQGDCGDRGNSRYTVYPYIGISSLDMGWIWA